MRDEPKINDGCIAWRLNMDPICCIIAAINSDVHLRNVMLLMYDMY